RPRRSPPPPDAGRPGRVRLPPPGAAAGADGVGGGGRVVGRRFPRVLRAPCGHPGGPPQGSGLPSRGAGGSPRPVLNGSTRTAPWPPQGAEDLAKPAGARAHERVGTSRACPPVRVMCACPGAPGLHEVAGPLQVAAAVVTAGGAHALGDARQSLVDAPGVAVPLLALLGE